MRFNTEFPNIDCEFEAFLDVAYVVGKDGRGIVSITKTSTVGNVDTYTILYTDDTTSTFTVTNGGGVSDWDDIQGKPSTFPPSEHNHDDRYYTAQEVDGELSTLNGKIEVNSQSIGALEGDISSINSVIPNQASEDNQLADKDFVNSSIATNTANFIGTFDSVDELEEYIMANPVTNNDYAYVTGTDTAGNTYFDRYKILFDESTMVDPIAQYEFRLNNSSFTAEQWSAITSGITSGLVEKLQEMDLSNYVQKTDYAESNKIGVMQGSVTYCIPISSSGHHPYCDTITFDTFKARTNSIFISKGTLNNVLNAMVIPQIKDFDAGVSVTIDNNVITMINGATGNVSAECSIDSPTQSGELIFLTGETCTINIQGISNYYGADCENGVFTPQGFSKYDILVSHDGTNPYAIVMKL